MPPRLRSAPRLEGGEQCLFTPHPSLLLGLRLPLNLLSGEVGREKAEKEAALVPGGGSSRSDPASNKRRSGRDGIVDPAPGSPGRERSP